MVVWEQKDGQDLDLRNELYGKHQSLEGAMGTAILDNHTEAWPTCGQGSPQRKLSWQWMRELLAQSRLSTIP